MFLKGRFHHQIPGIFVQIFKSKRYLILLQLGP